ncbi:prohead protease/major capsid protein fusion protein [Ancylobacter defluvii]|uniref:Peptidase n=1 Tax=Ancylobacter defluvii TaxID=1282440 RepID=A0A9W6JY43_9HYPH|nr:prohead protease/major capsid protein fusion protein [Ancylobacter defluvii]MBS7589054.1 Mu-like prophage major head subunit gpT family protein [Ancylobacter defluvii]GLK84663.1 hypothetical protein GCM10017653_27330 [Ancylobacter defluvii]
MTFEAVAATSTAGVRRRDGRSTYVEVLDVASVDTAALVDLPVLDNHRRASGRDVVGIVQRARIEGDSLIVTVRMSQADDARPLVQRAKDGLLSLSIGYTEAGRTESVVNGERVRTVTPAIFEVSLVAVPADRAARVRSGAMPDIEEIEDRAPLVPEMPEADQARIRSIGELADLPPSFAEGQISTGATIEGARAAARAEMIRRSEGTRTIRATVSQPDPGVQLRAMGDALDARVNGTAPSEAGRPFIGASLRDLATECLHARGVSTRGMNPDALFRAAHTTSDFPHLLQGVGARTLLASYTAAASPLRQVARQGSRADFRPGSTLKLGELSALSKVTESGEVKAVSRSEAAESYVLDTYAGMFSITRKALINDDLNAFADWSRAAGQAAAATEAGVLWSLLSQASGAGPVMNEDSKRLFHADHGNLLTGAALDVDSLSGARLALRTMKGLDGKTVITVTPRYLVVGPELETVAEQVLAAITATTVADVNPFAGKLTLLVEPRITDDAWYIFGDPATAPVLEYSYLSSAPGPQMASREGWDVLSTEYRVVLDFGAGAVDWRGAVRNPGE